MATKIYLCLTPNDLIADIMVTDYEMIHPCRIPWDVADYTLKGDFYNRATGLVEDAPPTPPDMICTRLEFRQKFTLTEMQAIYTAEATDAVVRIILDDLNVSEFVDCGDPATQNGIGYLYQAGYITYERMLEILG